MAVFCMACFRDDEVQMVVHVLKINKVPLFAENPLNTNVSSSAAPKLALVPASHYDCHI